MATVETSMTIFRAGHTIGVAKAFDDQGIKDWAQQLDRQFQEFLRDSGAFSDAQDIDVPVELAQKVQDLQSEMDCIVNEALDEMF